MSIIHNKCVPVPFNEQQRQNKKIQTEEKNTKTRKNEREKRTKKEEKWKENLLM